MPRRTASAAKRERSLSNRSVDQYEKDQAEVEVSTQATADASIVQAWPFMLCYILFPLMAADFYGLLPLSPNFGPIFIFVLIPLFDVLLGLDTFNPPAGVFIALERRFEFRIVTLLWFPCQLLFILWACHIALPEVLANEGYLSARWWGLLFNVGVSAGVGINMGHELIHKQPWYEHYSGALSLCLCCYGHFTVEHVDGHHRRVATLEDPATSRLNEWVYTFWFRSIVGGFVSAFRENFVKCTLLWAATLGFSLWAIPAQSRSFFYLQGLLGIMYLETVNYLEHYGLLREPGQAVTPMHSWNAGQRTTNYFLLKLQRHSDHHAYGGRRYQSLRSWNAAPQLPSGYATMILAALVPPLWFHIMNPRVQYAQELFARLKAEGRLEEVFTDKYLEEHPDAQLPFW